MAAGPSLSRNSLEFCVLALALVSAFLEYEARRALHADRALGAIDDARLAAEAAAAEREIITSYSQGEIDDSAVVDVAFDGSAPGVDPMTPNLNGEFEVPTAADLQGIDTLLASRLLFPIADESWITFELASSVPAGSYAIEIGDVIGQLGAHAAGGCLLLQVRFGGKWRPLVGSPRRRSQQPADAPLTHCFVVPHPFEGVRLLASAPQRRGVGSGGRVSLRHLGTPLSAPPPPPQKRSRYLVFEVDRGFGAAHLGLFNGIALAWSLNVTAVLPVMHTYHDLLTGQRRADPNAPSAYVPFDAFFDSEALISALSPMLRVVRSLPTALKELASQERPQPVAFISLSGGRLDAGIPVGASARDHGRQPPEATDWQRLWEHFRTHNVLRVGSLARKLAWTTPGLAHLRLLLHAGLRPAAAIETLANQLHGEITSFAERKQLAPSFVGVQLPLGSGWVEYCRQERLSALGDGGGASSGGVEREADWQRCDVSAEAVTQVLEERQVGELSRVLFVAGALNITHIMQLHKQRFVVMSRARFTINIHPDLAPSVDMALCRRAALFVGNLYSSFSFVLREAKLAVGESERAMYYNLDPSSDLTMEEALRWDVLPFVGS